MNKLVKGAIAGGAGIILLMGGAGSLAYWNDTANTGPATGANSITAGTLTITAANAGSWTKGMYNNAGTQTVAPAAIASLAAVKVVPGNRLVYTQNFNISGTGDDLFFTIGKVDGAVTAASSSTQDVALRDAINNSAASTYALSTVSGGTVVASTTAGVYKVSSNSGANSTVTVTWTINIPFGASADNSTKTGAVNLTQGSITLTQVAAP